jgi:hypothetical protein
VGDERDTELRRAALRAVRVLERRHEGLVPLEALRRGLEVAGRRISFGSLYSGRLRRGDGPLHLPLP